MNAKRALDILISVTILLLTTPLLFACSILVVLTMGYPVVFKQKRVGQYGNDFWVYKLRTMRDLYDSNGEPLPDSMRRTWFGDFLRAWSIDELPQFINVLIGNMSVVGPRPLLRRYLANCNSVQLQRLDVLPGLTGLAQIRGRKGLDYEQRFMLDIWYVRNCSIKLDMKIMFMTVGAIIRHEGIEETGQEYVPVSVPHSSADKEDRPVIRVI